MAGTEELMARLQRLEDGYYGDREAARQQKFFDTYGSRFSNNRGLGLAILNELDARGIDTSAADEAVQQILDTLRSECNEILELTKQANEAAIENAQKIETVANVVNDAVASNPDATPPDTAPDLGSASAEIPPAMDTMDPNGEFNPDAMSGETPPAGEELPPEPAEPETPSEPPAEPETPSEPPAEPDQGVVSDARLKRVNRMKDRWGKTHTQKKLAKKEEGYKPSNGILSACGGNCNG